MSKWFTYIEAPPHSPTWMRIYHAYIRSSTALEGTLFVLQLESVKSWELLRRVAKFRRSIYDELRKFAMPGRPLWQVSDALFFKIETSIYEYSIICMRYNVMFFPNHIYRLNHILIKFFAWLYLLSSIYSLRLLFYYMYISGIFFIFSHNWNVLSLFLSRN